MALLDLTFQKILRRSMEASLCSRQRRGEEKREERKEGARYGNKKRKEEGEGGRVGPFVSRCCSYSCSEKLYVCTLGCTCVSMHVLDTIPEIYR